MDKDYLPSEEEIDETSKKKRKPKHLLKVIEPQLKVLAPLNLSPSEIASTLNSGRPEKDKFTNKQISDKINRMKKVKSVKTPPVVSTVGIEATSMDDKWYNVASKFANENDEKPWTNSPKRSLVEDINLYAEKFLRLRSFQTESHFYIMAEACVNRQYKVIVDEEDERIAVVKAKLRSPDDVAIEQLFSLQAAHVSPFRSKTEKFSISLKAERKLNRHVIKSTAWPVNKPLWYGFIIEFDSEPVALSARNVDLTNLFVDEFPTKKRKLDEVEKGNDQEENAQSS